jgi:hypothetical protein
LALKLLAKAPELSPLTKEFCGWDINRNDKRGNAIQREARFPYFHAGFIDMDVPRDSAYTRDIVDATVSYGVGDEQGRLLAEYPTLEEAIAARDNARVTLSVEVPVTAGRATGA